MKVPFNPFQTRETLEGVLYAQQHLVDQPVTTTSDVRFRSCKIDKDVLIEGNLQVTGSTTILDTEMIQFKDQILEINSERRPMSQAGLQISRRDAEDYFFVFDEMSRLFKVGTLTNSKSLATVQDHPPALGIAVWDPVNETFNVTNHLTDPVTLDTLNCSNFHFQHAGLRIDDSHRLVIESQAGINLVNLVYVPDLWIQDVHISVSPAGALALQVV
ncbi:hypothetical protein HK102_012046 [Quaeritorhiza haematococci]|nr:hypothetical protein HK102_012046 [Quaeritorhiza haematococci]